MLIKHGNEQPIQIIEPVDVPNEFTQQKMEELKQEMKDQEDTKKVEQ